MNERKFRFFGIVAVLVSASAGYYWQQTSHSTPSVQVAKASAPKPTDHYPIAEQPSTENIPAVTPDRRQPAAEDSHDSLAQSLETLFGKDRLYALFNMKNLISHFVVSVVNATDHQLPSQYSIFKPLPDSFRVVQNADGTVLSAENYSRYASYLDLLAFVKSEKLVAVYARHYSLFQSAYHELGMEGYFNDRLVAAIDNAMAVPDVHGPVALIVNGYYTFADPKLESLSAAQKILIRMGPTNAHLVKNKLKSIRDLLTHLDHT